MAKKIYIIHGWMGSSRNDWIGWANDTFKAKGYDVVTPDMPDTENPKINEWVDFLTSTVKDLNNETYFIGHSIGCQAIMRFLEKSDTKIAGAIFVAGWFNLTNLEDEESEKIAEPWIKTSIDLDKVRSNLGYSVLMLGDNDPWVPYEETKKEFESKLGSEIVTLKGAGHVTIDDGFGPFEKLVEVFEDHLKR